MRRALLVAPLVFVLVAWPALEENSGTYDEPFLVAAGYTYLTRGDFRLNPEHPPLVKELLALPLLRAAPAVSAAAERGFEAAIQRPEAQYFFGDRVLYGDNAPQPLLRRARLVALALAAALVLLVALWARDAFGVLGGAVAAGIVAFDPNLLAHGTLATTDLGFTLFFILALFLVRRTFRALGPAAVIATGLALGLSFAAKHSALLLVPIVLAAALLRLVDGIPWPVGSRGRVIATRAQRARALVLLLLLWALMSWATIWACYGFRYAGAADGRPLPVAEWTRRIRSERVLGEMLTRGEPVPDDDVLDRAVDARPPMLSERLITTASRHRLLPEGYLFGVAVATAQAQIRSNFLLGEISMYGWIWYFPFALLVKTPVATLLLVALALVLMLDRRDDDTRERREARFLVVAAALVLAGTMSVRVNIGLRHVLPVVPLLCVLAGYAPAALERRFGRRPAIIVGSVACLLVASETLAARPYFIPFFNVAAGGARGGLGLLSDSNLDWGQGLPALRRWMTAHDVERVNLCYFGSADPARYGIAFVPMAGTNFADFGELGTIGYRPRAPILPGYVAMSATHVQGTYLSPELRRMYAFFRVKEPVAVLARSIYVYWIDGRPQ